MVNAADGGKLPHGSKVLRRWISINKRHTPSSALQHLSWRKQFPNAVTLWSVNASATVGHNGAAQIFGPFMFVFVPAIVIRSNTTNSYLMRGIEFTSHVRFCRHELLIFWRTVIQNFPLASKSLFILRHGVRKHTWEDNARINLREIGCEGVDWIQVAQDSVHLRALVNTAMNFRVL
jgi:hypothetical protein